MSKRNYIIFSVFMIFAIFGLVISFFALQKNNKYKQNISQINAITSEFDGLLTGDLSVVVSETGDKEINNSDNSFNDIQITGNNFTLNDLKNIYSEAQGKSDDSMQIFALQKLYEISKDPEYLYLIIDKAINLYNFDLALKTIHIVKDSGEDISQHIDGKKYLYVLMNGMPLSPDNIKVIDDNISDYLRKGAITQSDADFYKALMLLPSVKIYDFKESVNKLGSQYDSIKSEITKSFQDFSSYKDVPDYYIYALLGFVMLKNGQFNIAERLSEEAVKSNSYYILPNQILAYSNFMKGKFTSSVRYFEKLLKIDSQNQDVYKLFLGMSYFWNKDYQDSVIYHSQINTGSYLKDISRYLILSYYNINDYQKMIEYMDKLIAERPLDLYDYYNFFDLMFYKDFQSGKDYKLFNENTDLAVKYFNGCTKDVPKEDIYICVYGKAGYYMAKGNESDSLKYLQYISKYYKRDYIFQEIGNIYYKRNDTENAKKYYILSIVNSNDDTQKTKLKKQLLDLILQKEKK